MENKPFPFNVCKECCTGGGDGGTQLTPEQLKNINDIPNKVDKEDGKTLSSNDYTDEEKDKLEKLPTNDELERRFEGISSDISKLDGNVANAIKNTVSGTELEITDISPIVHNTKLKIRSKNRFDYSKAVFNEAICTVEQTETGLKAKAKTTNAQSVRMWIPFDGFEVGKTYILSSSLVSKTMGIHLVDTNSATSGITLGTVKDTNQYVFTIPEKKAYLRIYIYNDVAEANEVYYLDNFQIEEGEEITDYEGYISPDTMRVSVNGAEYIPNSDGTIKNVISTYPSMEITSDTPGAIITCEYNRDSNKVIEELTNAIISLGGNI